MRDFVHAPHRPAAAHMPHHIAKELVASGRLILITLPDKTTVTRSTVAGSLEQHAVRLDEELRPIFDALASKEPAAAPVISPQSVAHVGLLCVARRILADGFIGYSDAARLHMFACESFLSVFAAKFDVMLPAANHTSTLNDARLSLLLHLPVMSIPFRPTGSE